MSIYTKTGDTCKTALFGGKRVWKYDLQVEAYGITDEVTCFIGSAIESIPDGVVNEVLTEIQIDLYSIMAYLSGAKLQKENLSKHIIQMEETIDELDKSLPKLVRFVLPQGSEPTTRLHIARAKVRTSERRIVEFVEMKQEKNEDDLLVIQYMNRLSDFLFMLSRKYVPQEKKT